MWNLGRLAKQLLVATGGGFLNRFACLSPVFWCAISQWNCDPIRGCTGCSGPLCVSLQVKYEEIARWWRLFVTHHLMHSEDSHIARCGIQKFCDCGEDLNLSYDWVLSWWFVTFVVSSSLSIVSSPLICQYGLALWQWQAEVRFKMLNKSLLRYWRERRCVFCLMGFQGDHLVLWTML